MRPGPTSGAGPHVLVVDVESPVLGEDDRHHLERVLRLREGSPMTVGDGAGHWRPCRFGPSPEPTGPVAFVPRAEPALTVGFALIKAGRPELVVQKLTELGIDRIVPFLAERSVVRWDESRASRNIERLARVAREAVMQSRRLWSPEVSPVATFDALIAQGAALADGTGEPLGKSDTTVLIGPEGGWSDAERAAAERRVVLGPNVLRSETAAIAAATLMAARRAGF